MSRVFFGLFLSLLTACIGLVLGQYVPIQWHYPLIFVELGMLVVAMLMQRSRRIGMTFVLAFTLISGMTLFPIIALYTSMLGATMVLEAAAVTGVAFLITAIVASRTEFDFTFLRGFLFVGLLALLLLGVGSLFINFGSTMSMVYTLLGIAIFIGYILFDVNRMVHHGVSEQMVPWIVLSLYLDVVNLFLFILSLFGLTSSRR